VAKLLTGIATAEKSKADLGRFSSDVVASGVAAAFSGKPPQTSMPTFAANPQTSVPDARQIERNYPQMEDHVRQLAQTRHPNDPEYTQIALSRFQQEAGRIMQAQRIKDQSDIALVHSAMNGGSNGRPATMDDLRAQGPEVMAAVSSLLQGGKIQQTSLDEMLKHNAKGDYDPTPTSENQKSYYQLMGQAASDPSSFADRDLGDVYGQIPFHQYQQLVNVQAGISKKDAREADRQQSLNHAMTLMTPDLNAAGIVDDKKNKSKAELYAEFQGRMVESMARERDANGGKRLTDDQVKDIGRQLLITGRIQGSGFFKDDLSTVSHAQSSGTMDKFYVPFGDIPQTRKSYMTGAWSQTFKDAPTDSILSQWETARARLDQIPAQDRNQITDAFRSSRGRSPTRDEIAMLYTAKQIRDQQAGAGK